MDLTSAPTRRERTQTDAEPYRGFTLRTAQIRIFTDGLDFYPRPQAARLAAKTATDGEEGGPPVDPQ